MLAAVAEEVMQLDELREDLTSNELSRAKCKTSQLEIHPERIVKRSHCNDIREIPESDDDEEPVRLPVVKKAKSEVSPKALPAISKARLAEQQAQAAASATQSYHCIPIHTMESLPSRRKRSNSLPQATPYNACVHVSATRNNRPFHHDVATMHGFKFDEKAVIEMIRVELRAHSLDISNMVFERFSRMLPGRDASRGQLAILQKLFVQPMLLSNAELGQILCLEVSNKKYYTREDAGSPKHLFYIRSWTFTPAQLYSLSKSMKDDGLTFPELDEWEFTSFMARSRKNLTVRGSLLGALQHYLERSYPQIFHNAEIHVIPDMSLEIFGKDHQIGNQLNADDTESLLIHLLGHHSLVNLQLGGHHIRYLPDGGDEIIFKKLHTRYLEDFFSGCSAFPENKWSDLTSCFRAVLAGIPEIDGPASKSVKDILENQAKPYQYFGRTIMVFLGEELTGGHLKARCSFLNGPSKSSRIVRNFVHRIKNIEKSSTFGDYAGPCYDWSRAFTFLNTVPLPKYSDNVNSLKLLTAYLQCTRPIIVITFGQKAASTVISNLTTIKDRSKSTKASFTLRTCQLAACSYGPDENDVFIHIPLNHPGKYQYGSRSPVELRFFYISMHFAFFVASCTIEVIKRCSKSAQRPLRRDLCMKVLAHVERRLQTGTGFVFLSNMEQARNATITNHKSEIPYSTGIFDYLKNASREWFENQETQEEKCYTVPNIQKSRKMVVVPLNCFIRVFTIFGKKNSIAILEEENFRRILSFGVAVGEAYSSERQQDLDRVWAQGKQELHLLIPHSEDQRETWMKQFMSLQQGQSYFLQVLSQIEDCDYLQALVDHQPSWLPLEPSMKDVICEGVIKCGFWVHKRLPKQSVTLYPSPFITAKEMQGYPIGIKDDGEFQIRWKHPSGINKCLLLYARFAVPQSSRESRALSFTEHGLDIVDASGNPLRPLNTWSGDTSKASISKKSFSATSPGQLLIDLWTAVRQEYGYKVDKVDIEGSREWGPKGQKMLSGNATKEIPQQNRPPLENDANFLLVKFLDERFPNGGIFRTAPKEKVPDSTQDLQAFVEFCRKSEYINHPYASQWLGMLERDMPRVATLGKNIQIYRDCTTERYNGWQPHLFKMVGETRFHIGPGKGERA